MTHKIIITIVLSVLLVTAQPAAAANTATLQHTNASELNSATTTNMEVVGSGDSASVEWPTSNPTTLDGFEDGDISEWSGDGISSGYYEVSQAKSHTGTYSLEFARTGSISHYQINRSVAESSYENISVAIYVAQVDLNADAEIDIFSGGTRLMSLSWVQGRDTEIAFENSSTEVSTGISYSEDSWYTLEVTNIDYSSGTYDIELRNTSGVVGTYEDAEFVNSGPAGVDDIRLGGSESIWYVDDIDADKPAETGSYTSAEYDVSDPTQGFVDIENIQNADATVKWQYDNGGGWTTETTNVYSTSGNKSVPLTTNSDKWRVQVDFANTSTTDYHASVSSEGVQFSNDSPGLSNPSPTGGEKVSSSPVNLSVDVSDSEFSSAQGDSVTVEFKDENGSTIGTDTLTSAGTASVQWDTFDNGNNTWSATASDSYGGSASTSDQTFTSPANLYVYNESNPDELVDNVSVDLRFYFDETDGSDLIISRTASNGVINMSGMPANQPFVVVAEADGYLNRRIYVPSLFEAQQIYLLPDDKPHVTNEFVFSDFSGEYPSEHTVMFIQRAINGSWQTVQADYFGATDEFTAQLRYNERHRLIILNTNTGEQRNIGTYTPIADGTRAVEVTAGGEVELKQVGALVNINPAVRSLPAAETSVSADVHSGNSSVLWANMTVLFEDGGQTTTLASVNQSSPDGQTISQTVNLSGKTGGTVTVVVDYQTVDGLHTSEAEFRVHESYVNEFSLLNVLGGVSGLLPAENVEMFQLFVSVVATVLITTGVAARMPASTELVGFTAVGSIAGFSLIGFVDYSVVFVATTALVIFAMLRRGL